MNGFLEKLQILFTDPYRTFHSLIFKFAPLIKNDELYLSLLYYFKFHKRLDLKHPKTFNEKLQWLKLYDRNPEYTQMVDKYEAKKYVANIIGEEYIIPTLGVWDREEIDVESLPNQFVLKCTHDSGGLVICKDKNKLDRHAARAKMAKYLKRRYFTQNREWPYKNVKPRIIAEKYMEDESGEDLKDYKIHCFNGEPKMTLVCSERFSGQGLCEDFFDNDWKHLPIKRPTHSNDSVEIACPKNFELMKELASRLSRDIPFVRTDFYEINGRVYFGELTFFPASGMERFVPDEWDYMMGEWLKLTNIKTT